MSTMGYTTEIAAGYVHRIESREGGRQAVTLVGPERLARLTTDRDLVAWNGSEQTRFVTLTFAREQFDQEAGRYTGAGGPSPRVMAGLPGCKSPLWDIPPDAWLQAEGGVWTLGFDFVRVVEDWLGGVRPVPATAFLLAPADEGASNIGCTVTVA